MAILTYAQPDQYALAYNDNVYVFRSSIPTTTKRFKVYVLPEGSLTPIATLIIHPTPATNGSDDRAFVNVSRVLQSKITHDIEIPVADHLGFTSNTNSHYEYVLAVREQDIDANGAYQDEGQLHFYDTKSVWNGTQDLIDWLDFDINEYLLDSGVGNHKFLTEGPTGTSYRDITQRQSAFLYAIGTEDTAPKGYYLTTYDDFDAQGSQLSNILVHYQDSPSMDLNYDNRYFRIPVGTYDIPLVDSSQFSSGNPATVLNGVKSYSIRLWDSTLPISEVVTFNIGKKCSKYTPIRLHWMNRLGGFDAFNFILKNEEKVKVDRKNFYKQHRTFTGTGWNYDKMDRGTTSYDIQTTRKLTVNTDYLNDTESAWMESLFSSPVVYQELNNELIAIILDGRSIDKKTSVNNKLNQYTFDLEYSLGNSRQRG